MALDLGSTRVILICAKLRFEQYFQVQGSMSMGCHRNGNSFIPAALTTSIDVGSQLYLIQGPVTVDDKTQKKE
ncbi:hypothetical protein Tco_1376219 [Tanacetum coccineum]